MYACTSNSYRQIASADEAVPGETVSDDIPQTVLLGAEAMEQRSIRDHLLRSCDWTQITDSSVDSTTRQAFVVYRQALRDVPSQSGFPMDIVWPTPPSLPIGASISKGVS